MIVRIAELVVLGLVVWVGMGLGQTSWGRPMGEVCVSVASSIKGFIKDQYLMFFPQKNKEDKQYTGE